MFFYFFIVSTVCSTCLHWECHSLNYTVCAELRGQKIYANSAGCPIDFYCNLNEFYDWYTLENPSSNALYHCTRQNYALPTYEDLDDGVLHYCGNRDPLSELASGTHPKECTRAQDCVDKAGHSGSCECGLDGKFYCVPELGSTAFNEYWDECAGNYARTASYSVSSVSKAYWDFYQKYYIEVVSSPPCLSSLLYEFRVLTDYYEYTLNAGSCLVTSLIVLLTNL